MKTLSPRSDRLTNWLKKNLEGRRLVQWISYFMVFSVLVIFILEYPLNAKLDWRFYGAVLILGLLLVINILFFQSHWPGFFAGHQKAYFWTFNLLTNILVLGALALTGSGEIIFLLFLQAAQFANMFRVWPDGAIYSAASLAISAGILKFYGLSNTSMIQLIAQYTAGLIFVLVFVHLESRSAEQTRRAQDLLKALQAANNELKSAQEKEKELALAQERVRLARDIHDGLGHHLTVLSIQLQAAEKLTERNPKAAVEAIQTSRREAQAALEEVRHSVGMMRETPGQSRPLGDELASLVNDFDRNSGLHSVFEQTGKTVELPPFARQTLYRAVQESLTNAHKHAVNVRHIWVRLEYLPETVCLNVRDDGQSADSMPARKPGYGLVGLQERVDQLGGIVHSGPMEKGGFELEVSIPLREAQSD